MYAQDYDEHWFASGQLPERNPNGTQCDTAATRGPDGTNIVRMMGGGLSFFCQPYIKNEQIFTCPSDSGENYWGRNSTGWGWSGCSWWGKPTAYHFRHVFDCSGTSDINVHKGAPEANLGQPANQIVMFETSAFHIEKLPMYGGSPASGYHPSATPVRPPDLRTVVATFADGHAKVFRLGFKSPPLWNANHDLNWFLLHADGTPDNAAGGLADNQPASHWDASRGKDVP